MYNTCTKLTSKCFPSYYYVQLYHLKYMSINNCLQLAAALLLDLERVKLGTASTWEGLLVELQHNDTIFVLSISADSHPNSNNSA